VDKTGWTVFRDGGHYHYLVPHGPDTYRGLCGIWYDRHHLHLETERPPLEECCKNCVRMKEKESGIDR
jgi:hypothetical protein